MYRISGLTFLDHPVDLQCCSEKSLAFMAKSLALSMIAKSFALALALMTKSLALALKA